MYVTFLSLLVHLSYDRIAHQTVYSGFSALRVYALQEGRRPVACIVLVLTMAPLIVNVVRTTLFMHLEKHTAYLGDTIVHDSDVRKASVRSRSRLWLGMRQPDRPHQPASYCVS